MTSRPYRQEILLADVDLETDLEPGVAHVSAARAGVVFVFALGERAPWRVLATHDTTDADADTAPEITELQRLLDAGGLAARVSRVGWSDRLRAVPPAGRTTTGAGRCSWGLRAVLVRFPVDNDIIETVPLALLGRLPFRPTRPPVPAERHYPGAVGAPAGPTGSPFGC